MVHLPRPSCCEPPPHPPHKPPLVVRAPVRQVLDDLPVTGAETGMEGRGSPPTCPWWSPDQTWGARARPLQEAQARLVGRLVGQGSGLPFFNCAHRDLGPRWAWRCVWGRRTPTVLASCWSPRA